MIQLTYKQYRDKLKVEQATKRPTEHVFENDKLFLFFFKSFEGWKYYTTIYKKEVLAFSEIDDFKMNYCTHCLPVKSVPSEIEEQVNVLSKKRVLVNSKNDKTSKKDEPKPKKESKTKKNR